MLRQPWTMQWAARGQGSASIWWLRWSVSRRAFRPTAALYQASRCGWFDFMGGPKFGQRKQSLLTLAAVPAAGPGRRTGGKYLPDDFLTFCSPSLAYARGRAGFAREG